MAGCLGSEGNEGLGGGKGLRLGDAVRVRVSRVQLFCPFPLAGIASWWPGCCSAGPGAPGDKPQWQLWLVPLQPFPLPPPLLTSFSTFNRIEQ